MYEVERRSDVQLAGILREVVGEAMADVAEQKLKDGFMTILGLRRHV